MSVSGDGNLHHVQGRCGAHLGDICPVTMCPHPSRPVCGLHSASMSLVLRGLAFRLTSSHSVLKPVFPLWSQRCRRFPDSRPSPSRSQSLRTHVWPQTTFLTLVMPVCCSYHCFSFLHSVREHIYKSSYEGKLYSTAVNRNSGSYAININKYHETESVLIKFWLDPAASAKALSMRLFVEEGKM